MQLADNPTLDPQTGAENTTALLDSTMERIKDEDAAIEAVTRDTTKYPYYRVDPETGNHIEITRAEYKAYMRKHVTRNYTRLPLCGHKFVPTASDGPRHRNCASCWFAFFQVHGELTQEVEKAYQEEGPGVIVQTRGPKFLKNWLKFMSTIAQWKKATEEAAALDKESNEQSVCGTGSSDGPVSSDGDIASGAD